MRRSRTGIMAALGAIALIAGCFSINVNVYFDQQKAEKAVDKVLDKVQFPGGEPDTDAVPEKHGRVPSAPGGGPSALALLNRGLLALTDGFCSTAEAADDFKLDVESPAINKITDRMKERWEKWLEPGFKRGNLGVSKEAQFVIRNLTGLADEKMRADFKKAVEEEKADHEELFREIAKANNLGKDAIEKIRKAFANRYRARALKGWWVEDDEGKWTQKAD
ncbi:MAG: DUF1318 domain-containing protein [Planctomycetes bacterium]|nr:DUF1318 domain-containing protein [Planctomycetota bacterium]